LKIILIKKRAYSHEVNIRESGSVKEFEENPKGIGLQSCNALFNIDPWPSHEHPCPFGGTSNIAGLNPKVFIQGGQIEKFQQD
jgi:hypothetical protein